MRREEQLAWEPCKAKKGVQFPEEDPSVEEGQGQEQREIPRRKEAEGTHMKELNWAASELSIKLEA